MQSSLRHTMKTHDKLLRARMRLPMHFYFAGQSINVAKRVVVVVDKAKLWQMASCQAPAVNIVKNAGRCGAAVLGVGWKHQYAVDTFCSQCIELRCNTGLAIGHGIAHSNSMAACMQLGLQELRLTLGPNPQG